MPDASTPKGYANPDALVSTEWLAEHLNAPDVRIVDGSWHLPPENRDPRAEFAARHIPGAVFFDIDEIADKTAGLPHMLPPPEMFSARVRRLGLGDGNRIVVYDTQGLFSAARVWWTFRVFGHRDVAVLDGGLPKWLAEGRPVEDGKPMPRERHFTARMDATLVRDLEQVRSALERGHEQVLDARAAARFRGEEKNPYSRPLRDGHMPGARNLPWASILQPDKTLLPADRLADSFREAGVDLDRPVVCTCGSGITACMLALSLHLLGKRNYAVYDGSWVEWGGRSDTPVVV